jgi:4-carboxymuconolactone decarboxylase
MTDHPTQQSLFDAGLPIRREVVGAAHVDRSMARANDFMMAAQHAAVEIGWGYIWARPGLDRKTRSLINLGMLTALRATNELKVHVKGAITNGATVDEIKETLLQAAVYCGMPAGLEAFRAANDVLVSEGLVPAEATA